MGERADSETPGLLVEADRRLVFEHNVEGQRQVVIERVLLNGAEQPTDSVAPVVGVDKESGGDRQPVEARTGVLA